MTTTNSRTALVWLLAAGAFLLGAVLWHIYGADILNLLAAFFAVLGDLLALLAQGSGAA